MVIRNHENHTSVVKFLERNACFARVKTIARILVTGKSIFTFLADGTQIGDALLIDPLTTILALFFDPRHLAWITDDL